VIVKVTLLTVVLILGEIILHRPLESVVQEPLLATPLLQFPLLVAPIIGFSFLSWIKIDTVAFQYVLLIVELPSKSPTWMSILAPGVGVRVGVAVGIGLVK